MDCQRSLHLLLFLCLSSEATSYVFKREICETGEKRFETTYGDGYNLRLYVRSSAIDDLEVEVEFADVGLIWTKTFSLGNETYRFVADRNGVTWTEVFVKSFRDSYCQQHKDLTPGASEKTCDVGKKQVVSFPDAVILGRNCNGRRAIWMVSAVTGVAIILMTILAATFLKNLVGCGCKKGTSKNAPAPANNATRARASRRALRGTTGNSLGEEGHAPETLDRPPSYEEAVGDAPPSYESSRSICYYNSH